jgi:L-asparaginase II
MDLPAHVPLVEVTRGEGVESIHYGSAVVVTENDNIITSLGDIGAVCYLRSSAKPFQALAFIERGGANVYHLTLKEIAIICASHSGTDDHIQTLQKLHKKIGISASDLQCGIHPPFDKTSAEALLMRGEQPNSLHHNCSGKHTGMLAFAKMIGAPLENYLDVTHPVQQAILKTFSEMCDVAIKDIDLATDGCSAPVFAIPLKNAALGFARLSCPDHLNPARADACRLIFKSMTAQPEMVAGPGQFDTVFMQAMHGKVLSKTGAEGYLAVGMQTNTFNSESPAMGMVIKISDGDAEHRAAPLVALELFNHMGQLNAEQKKVAGKFGSRPITNWRGLTVGEIRPAETLFTGH